VWGLGINERFPVVYESRPVEAGKKEEKPVKTGRAKLSDLAGVGADGWIYPDGVDKNPDGTYKYNLEDPAQAVLAHIESLRNCDTELFLNCTGVSISELEEELDKMKRDKARHSIAGKEITKNTTPTEYLTYVLKMMGGIKEYKIVGMQNDGEIDVLYLDGNDVFVIKKLKHEKSKSKWVISQIGANTVASNELVQEMGRKKRYFEVSDLARVDADGWIYPDGVNRNPDGTYAYSTNYMGLAILAVIEACNNHDINLMKSLVSDDFIVRMQKKFRDRHLRNGNIDELVSFFFELKDQRIGNVVKYKIASTLSGCDPKTNAQKLNAHMDFITDLKWERMSFVDTIGLVMGRNEKYMFGIGLSENFQRFRTDW
jgi:hypothetical protein